MIAALVAPFLVYLDGSHPVDFKRLKGLLNRHQKKSRCDWAMNQAKEGTHSDPKIQSKSSLFSRR